MSCRWWAEPTAGEIVWCHFPDGVQPRGKPRPALILAVFDGDAPTTTAAKQANPSLSTDVPGAK